MAKHWMQKAEKSMERRGTKGALHRELGVPEGKSIPLGVLEEAKHSKNPKLRRRANFAINAGHGGEK